MRWGRKRGGDPQVLEDCYRALARLVERHGFTPKGLTIVEVDGGYLVRGLRATTQRGGVTVSSETIGVDELLAEIEVL